MTERDWRLKDDTLCDPHTPWIKKVTRPVKIVVVKDGKIIGYVESITNIPSPVDLNYFPSFVLETTKVVLDADCLPHHIIDFDPSDFEFDLVIKFGDKVDYTFRSCYFLDCNITFATISRYLELDTKIIT